MDIVDAVLSHKLKGKQVNGERLPLLKSKLRDVINELGQYEGFDYKQLIFSAIAMASPPVNNVANLDLFEKLMVLQYEYYKRNTDIDEARLARYKSMSYDVDKIYSAYSCAGENQPHELVFHYNPLASIKHNQQELDVFYRNAKDYIALMSKMFYSDGSLNIEGTTPVMVFCKEIVDNTKLWGNRISNWQRNLKVYDYRYIEDMTCTEITRKLGTYNKNENANPLGDVREYLAEAERLKQSAFNDTFPL